MTNPNQYRTSLNKVTDNLLAELAEGDEINWHTIELIGQELIVLSVEAKREQVKQRQEYIKSKYKEKE